MTLFEYLSVAFSIVLSLSAAQILSSVRAVLAADRRYWVHVGWIAVTLYAHVIIWWEFWALREVEHWTLMSFMVALISPGLLFVASNALTDAGTTKKWEDHYFASRGSFFVPMATLLLYSLFRDAFLLGNPVVVLRNLPEVAMTILCLIAWRSTDRRLHGGVVLVNLGLIVAGSAFTWLDPGGGSLQ